MKRFVIAVSVLIVMIVIMLFSGCSVVRDVLNRVLPHPTAMAMQTASVTIEPMTTTEPEESPTLEPETSPTPEPETTPEQADTTSEATADPTEVVSTALGVAFTVPGSWAGKYRVVEGDGYLSLFFVPSVPFDDSMGDGFLFAIEKRVSEDEDIFLDSVLEVEINGVTYVCGTSTDVSYSPEQPEYETYKAMLDDYPDIVQTIRAVGS